MGEIQKSPSDPRGYLYARLTNGLQCLVISDPETDISAGALCVAAGSLRDPGEVPGLAHFLEHMLFLGTRKYPHENTYHAFLKANAGTSNAYTGQEETNYFFSVGKEKLEEALDIFAQFFIAPLFNESCVDREMHAVDSEHEKNLQSDNWRVHQLLCSLAHPSHPFNHFSTGSLQTLQLPDIRQRLIRFYRENYSAQRMAMVLIGSEDAETLMQWCVDRFSQVPNYAENQPMQPLKQPYFQENLCSVTQVVSVMDRKEVQIFWQLPGMQGLYQSKPEWYLSHLLGHEGVNSVLSYLKSEGLALGLSVTADSYSFRDYCLFEINIEATDAGMEKYETILEVVYSYINMMKKKGVTEWIFREIQHIADAQFAFKSRTSPISYACKLASSLHKYPSPDVLPALYLVQGYRPDLIHQLLDMLNPRNMKVFLISNLYQGQCKDKEFWYGTEHMTTPISEELIVKLVNADVKHASLVLDLPPVNPYIPTKFEVIPPGEHSLPMRIHSSDISVMYHKQNGIYPKDTVLAYVNLICGDGGYYTDPKAYICGVMWRKLYLEKTRELSYMASQAGLNLTVSSSYLGLEFSARGFSQHFGSYLLEAFTQAATLQVTPQDHRFLTNTLHDTHRSLQNRYLGQPYEQALASTSDLMYTNLHYTVQELIQAIKEVSIQDIIKFTKSWLREIRLEWLVIGNITAEKAMELGSNCSLVFRYKREATVISKVPLEQAVFVRPEEKLRIYEVSIANLSNKNSCAVSVWQLGPETVRGLASLMVIESILKEPCFSTLRTQKQLGYIVLSGILSRRQMLNYCILVQSHKASPLSLSTHISDFLLQTRPLFTHLSDEIFLQHQQSVFISLSKKDVSLEEEFARYVGEMTTRQYEFARKEIVSDAVVRLKKVQVTEAFERLFFTSNRRLDVHYVSKEMRTEQEQLCASLPLRRYHTVKSMQAAISTNTPRL